MKGDFALSFRLLVAFGKNVWRWVSGVRLLWLRPLLVFCALWFRCVWVQGVILALGVLLIPGLGLVVGILEFILVGVWMWDFKPNWSYCSLLCSLCER